MRLQDSNLFRQQCYVNGQWVDAADRAVIEVKNPATGELVGTVPSLSKVEVAQAIDHAQASWDVWKNMPVNERGALLHKLNTLMAQHVDDLAIILTTEQGKPLAEARAEILQGATYLPWFAGEARRAYGAMIPPSRMGVRPLTFCQPVGVVAAIIPWNFPSSMLLRKAAPALAAGCPVLVKPASQTPFSSLAIAELAHRAGFPAGVFAVITGNAGLIGDEITANPIVRKLSFTGSTEVGKKLTAKCAANMKHVSMELGGNAPFIVFDDADLNIAVNCAVGSKFRNCGQTCISADRFLIQRGVYAEFIKRLSAWAALLRVGNGMEPGVEQGPLIGQAARDNMDRLMKDAVEKGARVCCGGKNSDLGPLFFEATVLADVTPGMCAWHEEIFGPIAPVMPFATEKDAIRLANDSPYGLAAYIFTKDIGRTFRVSEALEFGMVGVNDTTLASAEVPFGGIKDSGMGREGGREGLQSFLETKYVLLADLGL